MSKALEDMANIFKIFSDPSRLKLLKLLFFNDKYQLKVIEIAEKIGISQPAISQHIRILKQADLIKNSKEKNQKIYFINRLKFNKFLSYQVID